MLSISNDRRSPGGRAVVTRLREPRKLRFLFFFSAGIALSTGEPGPGEIERDRSIWKTPFLDLARYFRWKPSSGDRCVDRTVQRRTSDVS